MAFIKYYIVDYIELQKYIIRDDDQDYICISSNTKIKIYQEITTAMRLEVDAEDFVDLDMFFVEKNFKCKFGTSAFNNIIVFVRENCLDAINYLIETDFRGENIKLTIVIASFVTACSISSIDIIMSLWYYISPKELDQGNNDYIQRNLPDIFRIRDSDIINVLLENLPQGLISYDKCMSKSIEGGRLDNLVLLEKIYPDFDIADFLFDALDHEQLEIIEYLVSRGANLQALINEKLWIITSLGKCNDVEIIDFIMTHIVLTEDQLNELLIKSYKGTIEYVDILIDAGADFISHGEQLHEDAIRHNNNKLAAYLETNYL